MDLQPLTRPGTPWLHLLVDPNAAAFDALRGLERAHGPRPAVRIVRGAKATSVPDFYDEIAAALQFPTFGENWDALNDCLSDLRWLHADGLVLVVMGAAHLLDKAPVEQFGTLHGMLANVAQHWSRSSKTHAAQPFHVVLSVVKREEAAVTKHWTAVGTPPQRLSRA